MIVETIVNFGVKIFTTILSLFNLPSIGSNLQLVSNFFEDYIFNAFNFIEVFLPLQFFSVLLGLVVAVLLVEDLYSFVMWILRKIPCLGMS